MNMRLNLRFKTVKGAVALSNDGIDKINSILDNDTSEFESESENELSDPADISDDESADFDNLLFSEVEEEEEEEEEPVRRAGSRLVRGFIDKEAAVASPGSASGRKTKAADTRMAREAKTLRYYTAAAKGGHDGACLPDKGFTNTRVERFYKDLLVQELGFVRVDVLEEKPRAVVEEAWHRRNTQSFGNSFSGSVGEVPPGRAVLSQERLRDSATPSSGR